MDKDDDDETHLWAGRPNKSATEGPAHHSPVMNDAITQSRMEPRK